MLTKSRETDKVSWEDNDSYVKVEASGSDFVDPDLYRQVWSIQV